MSNSRIARLDERAHALFTRSGIADAGTLRQTIDGAPADTPCRVLVDRQLTSFLIAGVEFSASSALVQVLRADVSMSPRTEDVITVGTDGWIVDRIVSSDESAWVFLCHR